jgi:hypothetical protein
MNFAYLIRAIITRNFDKLNKLRNNKFKLDENALNYAILTNDINILKIIIDMGAKSLYLTLDYAIFIQNINIIKLVAINL